MLSNDWILCCQCRLSDIPKNEILLCDLMQEGKCIDRAFFLPKSWYEMKLSDCEPEILFENESSVRLRTPGTIPVLLLDRECVLSENGMFLK